MAIQFNIQDPNYKIIELGGGANPQFHPNVDVRHCVDKDGNQTTDFTANFEEPLPISSDEWDAVFSHFALEHVSWRKIPDFLKEVLRILKPNGKAVFVIPNTEAQIQWIKDHPEGWDSKPPFESASCVLFGDQDYSDNTHKAYFNPIIVKDLFSQVGFQDIVIRAYGDRDTDLCVEAIKPLPASIKLVETNQSIPVDMTREEMFDKHYFNGGGKVGGYAREGYWDYNCHEVTAQNILARKPESVLELACARGYVLKRIQDAGIPGYGLEISKHCYLSRVADNIIQYDICKTPWPIEGEKQFDLCTSIAFFEHVPEEFLPQIFEELKRVSKRGLHGIDFGHKDDGFDLTHRTLRPKSWWIDHMPIGHEVVDKEELEQGTFPEKVQHGDGKVKLNVGSFTTMFKHGWTNIDIHDLHGWAGQYGYLFEQKDVRQGLSQATNSVDKIMLCHFLEHLTYDEGLAFLKECRRVMKSDAVIRIIVPDAGLLIAKYEFLSDPLSLSEFDEINDGAANSPTNMGKLWNLLVPGHAAGYDFNTMKYMLEKAGFSVINKREFRQGDPQILRETLDMIPCLSLYVEASP